MSPRTHHLPEHPAADRPRSVETAGIESVADDHRHGTASELFWVWLGANIGIVGIIYGAVLTTLGLNLWQGAAAAVVGTVLSFVLVGVLGVAGKWGGAPMLGLSRMPFGRKGNLAPELVSWISLLGWETLTAVIAAYAVHALLATAWHVPPTKAWMLVSLLGVAMAALLLGRLGHATIGSVQRFVTWTFGLLTLAVLPWLVMSTHWSAVLAVHPGSWLAVVGGVGIVAASTGISWANLGADYSRYLPRRERGAAIVGWTTLGSVVPLTLLIIVQGDFFGVLVSFVQLLACGIATWAAVFIVDMTMRRGYGGACLESSGLVPTSHPADLAADRGVRLPALVAWLAGTVVGLLFTASPLFTGPLVFGIFAQSSLGYLLGFTVSAALYAVLGRDLLLQHVVAQPVVATRHDEAVNVVRYPPGPPPLRFYGTANSLPGGLWPPR